MMIKPRSESSSFGKIDRHDGLPLILILDLVFDKHLISFDEMGVIVISNRLISPECLVIDREMRLGDKFSDNKQGKYLAMHREKLRRLNNHPTE